MPLLLVKRNGGGIFSVIFNKIALFIAAKMCNIAKIRGEI